MKIIVKFSPIHYQPQTFGTYFRCQYMFIKKLTNAGLNGNTALSVMKWTKEL